MIISATIKMYQPFPLQQPFYLLIYNNNIVIKSSLFLASEFITYDTKQTLQKLIIIYIIHQKRSYPLVEQIT